MPMNYRDHGRWFRASTVGSTTTPPVVTNLPPTAVSGLTANPSQTSVVLSWTAATDPDGTVSSYQVLNGASILTTVATLSATISSLTASTPYTLGVRAVDNKGATGPTTTVNFTTLTPTTPPITTVTHGFQITAANTGYTAYTDPTLGRLLTRSDLTRHTTLVHASELTTSGGTITKHDFAGGLYVDIPCTVVACSCSGPVRNDSGGGRLTMNWCTITSDGGAAGDYGVGFDTFSLYRCNIGGQSDGLKAGGNCDVTECYIRTQSQDALDHNDGIQCSFGSGDNNIVRCNIDARPVNGGGGANGALFTADSSVGVHTWTDNYVLGGGYVLRMNESASYVVNGNWVADGTWSYGTYNHVNTPLNLITWANLRPNLVVSASGTTVSTIALS